jgi:hypothetical protein
MTSVTGPMQYTVPNVPRQLVVIGSSSTGVTFSGNDVTGTAGGQVVADPNNPWITPGSFGNTLVTIDAASSVIHDNDFTGYTVGGASLRIGGNGSTVTNNTIDHTVNDSDSAGFVTRGSVTTGTHSGNTLIGQDGAEDLVDLSMINPNPANIKSGTLGADTISGNGGDDYLSGGDGADVIDGGDGDDVIIIESAANHDAGETITGGDNATAAGDTVRFTTTLAETLVLDTSTEGVENVEISDVSGGNGGMVNANVDASLINTASLNGITLTGNAGNNILTGTAFDDTINGGAGLGDVAVYAGNRADYTVTKLSEGVFQVVSVAEGTDILKGVESIRFADKTVNGIEIDANSPDYVSATVRFDQGFDTNTTGLSPNGSTIALDTTPLAGETSYARITNAGAFTTFDGYRTNLDGGVVSSVKVYLDTGIASGQGFEISVAATRTNGAHLRDYIFHITKDISTGQLLVGASNTTNGAPRQDLDVLQNHAAITSGGWYTFEHRMYENELGDLEVAMNVYDAGGNWVFTEVRSDPADDVGAVAGGNRYMWFTVNNVAGGIAVDDITLKTMDDNPVQLVKGTGAQLGMVSATTILDSFETIEEAVAAALPGNIIDLAAKDYVAESSVDVTVNNLTFRGPAGAVNVDLELDPSVSNVTLGGSAPIDVTGNDNQNVIIGNAGANVIDGGIGNDTITGGGAVDVIDGGAGIDTAVYTDVASVEWTGTAWEVTSTADGTETLANIEVVDTSAAGRILLVNNNGSGGGYATIAEALADAESGDTVLIAAGTYNESNLVVDEDITIQASGGTVTLVVDGVGETGFIIEGDGAAGGAISIDGITITGSNGAQTGVSYAGSYDGSTLPLGSLNLLDLIVSGFQQNGLFVGGGGTGLDVAVTGGTYSGNGLGGQNGSGDITLFEFTGDAVFTNVIVIGTTGGVADNGIQIAGFRDSDNAILTGAGAIVFTNVSVTGDYEKTLVYLQGYNDFDGLNTTGGLTIGDAGSTSNWIALYIDGLPQGGPFTADGTTSLDLTGTTIADWAPGMSPSLAFAAIVAAGATSLVIGSAFGNDTIIGTASNDAIIGTLGNDNISGGAGEDLIYYEIGDGQDVVNGGANDDLVFIQGNGSSHTFNISAVGGTQLGVNIENGAFNLVAADALNSEVLMSNVEDLHIDLGGGGDSVNITTPLGGTGLSTSTITINGGAGDDNVWAGEIDAAHPVGVVFNGGGGDDGFESGAGNDTFDGGADGTGGDTVSYFKSAEGMTIVLENGTANGTAYSTSLSTDEVDTLIDVENVVGSTHDDHITGNDEDNDIYSMGGSDTIVGGGGEDMAALPGDASDYTVEVDEDGNYVFTGVDGGDYEDDVITIAPDVESVLLGATEIDLTGDVMVVNEDGNLVGTYDTIGDAVAAADEGFTVFIKGRPGVGPDYNESVNISEGINLVGVDVGYGKPTITSSGATFNLTGAIGVMATVSISNVEISGGTFGILAGQTLASLGSLIVEDVKISGAATNGFAVMGNGSNASIVSPVGAVTLIDSQFENNGDGSSGGDGDIIFFGYAGDATLSGLTLTGDAVHTGMGTAATDYSGPRTGIQFRADGNVNMGNVSIDGVTINGAYANQGIGIFNYDSVDGLTIGTIAPVNVNADSLRFNTSINFDGITDDLDFSNGAQFGTINTPNDPVSLQGDGSDQTITGDDTGEFIRGHDGADTLIGNGGDDRIVGDDDNIMNQTGSGNDQMTGGAGNDTLVGEGGIDQANFVSTTLNSAMFATVSDADSGAAGNQAGWTITTGGSEGTDSLTGVEIVDGLEAGRFLLVGNGGFDTIQAAIDEAQDGDTILIASGTYDEQIVVDNIDNLTIKAAAGADVTITRPVGSLVQTETSSSGRALYSVVTVTGSENVTIQGIDVDGLGTIGSLSGTQPNYLGVLYRNASGSLLEVDITGIRDPYEAGTTVGGYDVVSGNQRGVGLQVDNDGPALLDFTMTGGSITDFQKNATVFNRANLDITGVTITGGGDQTINAQNGIQVQNSTGSISNNIITGIGFAGPSVTYSGAILAIGNTDLDIMGNTIVGANGDTTVARVYGIWVLDQGPDNSGGEISGNIISEVDRAISVSGDVQPDAIDVHSNSVDDVDFTDSFAGGVVHSPTATLSTVFDVEGSAVRDILRGAAGNDTLTGLGGDDTLDGRAGADTMDGGAGNDTYIVDNSADIVIEAVGGGTDTVNTSVSYSLDYASDDPEVEVLNSTGNGLTLTGNDFAQTINGDAGANIINGNGGIDTLVGNGGADTFDSGSGSDSIYGGTTTTDDANTTIDTATYSSGATIAWNEGLGAWQVTDVGGTDTLNGIEKVIIGSTVHWLVDNDATNGGLSSIQDAITEASDGHFIHVGVGTFSENVTVNKGVTIVGANAGVVGTDLGRDAALGAGETTLSGTITITTTSAVTIDGFRFENVLPEGPSPDAVVTINAGGGGGGHVVRNSIFWSDVDGGDTTASEMVNPDPVRDDRAFHVGVGATTGSITIEDNYVTGSFDGKYGTASWGRGVWADYNGAVLVIEGNTFEYVRSGLNMDRTSGMAVEPTIQDNTFKDGGTAITFGGGVPTVSADLASVGQNTFDNVDTEFNLGNLTSGLNVDIQAKIDAFSDATVDNARADALLVIASQAADIVQGSSGTDWIEGRAGGDQLNGLNGNDVLLGEGGADQLDGGEGEDRLDGGDGFDELTGGADDDVLVGSEGGEVYTAATGEGDVAVYTGPVTTASIASVTDADLATGGDQAGWQITTGGEGTDLLSGVEIIDSSAGRILLVGSGGFATIQDAINEAVSGDTILIANGTYDGGIVINVENLTIVGESEAGVVIQGAGSGNGFDVQADIVTLKSLTVQNFTHGIYIATDVNDLTIDTVASKGHLSNWPGGSVIEKVGLMIENGADVDGLTVTNSHFDGSDYGMYFKNNMSGSPSTLTNFNISTTTFNDNALKGLYAEKLSNAVFDDVTVENSGHVNIPAILGNNTQAGFDINLKYGAYQNITITNSDFIDSGRYRPGSSAELAAGLTIKARDDAPSYNGTPATLSGVTVTGNTFTSNGNLLPDGTSDPLGTRMEVALRLGETGKDNNAFGGTVTITGNNFVNVDTVYADETVGTVAPGDVFSGNTIDGTANDVDHTGVRELGNNLIVGDDPSGNIILGGGGNDRIVGGSGNDVFTGGTGNDQLFGNGGDDHFHWSVGDGFDSFNGGADSDTIFIVNTDHAVRTYGVASATVVVSGTGGTTSSYSQVETIDITGGGATDQLVLLAGADGTPLVVFAAGGGTDTVNFTAFGSSEGVTVNLSNTSAQTITAGATAIANMSDVENVSGGAGNDTIIGSPLANVLTGGDGADIIDGGDHNDTIFGGEGADRIKGGAGSDTLNGQGDADVFVYSLTTEGGDLINGFIHGTDTFEFDSAGFVTLAPGPLAANQVVTSDVTTDDVGGAYGGFTPGTATFVLDTTLNLNSRNTLWFDENGDGFVDYHIAEFDGSSSIAGFNHTAFNVI